MLNRSRSIFCLRMMFRENRFPSASSRKRGFSDGAQNGLFRLLNRREFTQPATMSALLVLLAFILLTLITQIGGIALLIGLLLVKLFGRGHSSGWRHYGEALAAFLACYTVMTLFVVPPLASLSGRVPLLCGLSTERNYAAANTLYCALNRNYANARLKSLLEGLDRYMNAAFPGTQTLYLDANFPFFDGFPLLPHLSHDDGRKLDLAFYYTDDTGRYLPGALRSPIGYWGFEQPAGRGEDACAGKSRIDLRWDMNWLQPLLPDLKLDTKRTAAALGWLASNGKAFGVEKLFIEPYLAKRLGVSSPLFRFQGCRAARHDDHIHVQITP